MELSEPCDGSGMSELSQNAEVSVYEACDDEGQ